MQVDGVNFPLALDRLRAAGLVAIAGTDTGVGKTIFARNFGLELNRRGLRCGYYKPLESGCAYGSELSDTFMLKQALGLEESETALNPYRFELALAPAIAAEQIGISMERAKIDAGLEVLRRSYELVLLEAAGGLLAPCFKTQEFFVDYVRELACPLILVARAGLGTLNHTLLSLRLLQDFGIEVLAVVLNQYKTQAEDVSVMGNIEYLQDYLKKHHPQAHFWLMS